MSQYESTLIFLYSGGNIKKNLLPFNRSQALKNEKVLLIIKPIIIVDEEGREWLRPGMSFFTQRMLGIDRKTLWQIAKDGETLTIDDDVWEEVTSRELIWEPFHEGNRSGVRVYWRKDGLSGEIGEKT